MGSRAGLNVAAVGAVVAAWVVYWWPLLGGGEQLHLRDLLMFAGPAKSYWLERVSAGQVPHWIPGIDAGSPFLADAAYQAFYPGNLLFLYDAPIPSLLNGFILLHFVVGMLGLFALARSIGASRVVAAWAGIAYGLAGYPLAVADNITYVPGLAFAPVVLAAFISGVRHQCRRRLTLAAVALAMMLLAGNSLDAGISATACAAIAAAWLFRVLRERQAAAAVRTTALMLLVPVLALLLAAVQIVPTLALLPETVRALPMPSQERMPWSLPAIRLVELLHPYVFGGKWPGDEFLVPHLYPRKGGPWADSIYLGPVVLGLAVFAVYRLRREVAGWGLLAVCSLLLALGANLPGLLELTSSLPVLGRHRYFEKLLLWSTIALLVLAARGGTELLRHTDPGNHRAMRGPAIRALLAAVVLLAYWWPLQAVLATLPAERLATASAYWSERLYSVSSAAAGATVHAAWWLPLLALPVLLTGRWRRWSVAVLMGLAVADLLWVHQGRYLSAPKELVVDDSKPAGVELLQSIDPRALTHGRLYFDQLVPGDRVLMRKGALLDRLLVSFAVRGILQQRPVVDVYGTMLKRERLFPNAGIEHGVAYMNGDWSPLRSMTARTLERDLLTHDPALFMGLGGVRYVLTAEQPRNPLWDRDGFDEAAVSTEYNLRLLRVRHSAPLVYLSSRADVGPPAVDFEPAAGSVGWSRPRPESIVITVNGAPTARWLVLVESRSAGWKAWVDGHPADVGLAHGRFMAVAVAPGTREVRFEYRTPQLAVGAVLSGAGLVLAASLLLWPRRSAVRAADKRG